MIRYELKIPAIVTYRDKGIVDVQLRSGIKVTLKEDELRSLLQGYEGYLNCRGLMLDYTAMASCFESVSQCTSL